MDIKRGRGKRERGKGKGIDSLIHLFIDPLNQ
jgi:hypothetical protein